MRIQIEAGPLLAGLTPCRRGFRLQADGLRQRHAGRLAGCCQHGQQADGAVVQDDSAVRMAGKVRLLQPLLQQGSMPAYAVTLHFLWLVALPMSGQVGCQHAPARLVECAYPRCPQQAVAGVAVQQQDSRALERLRRGV